MTILADAFDFKEEKTGGFCVYQTTTTSTAEWDKEENACRAIGRHALSELPNAAVLSSTFTTSDPCAIVPAFTEILKCTLTLE